MPTDAFFRHLQDINAENIESLELITTPPTKLNAQGRARYNNLVLKKSGERSQRKVFFIC